MDGQTILAEAAETIQDELEPSCRHIAHSLGYLLLRNPMNSTQLGIMRNQSPGYLVGHDPTVVDELDGITPAQRRGHPVNQCRLTKGALKPKLLHDLASGPSSGRFAWVNHPAGELPIFLVGSLSQQDAPQAVTEYDMRDDSLRRQNRVHDP